MNIQLSLLVDLQKLDLRIHDIHNQQQNFPQRIDAAQAPVVDTQRQIDAVTAAVGVIAHERRSSEQDLSAHESYIQKLRTRLSDLKTNKEYQASLLEIEQANKKKDALEERVLSAMECGEQQQNELDQLHKQLAESETMCERDKTALESLTHTLEMELIQCEQQQKEVTNQIEGNLLSKYTALRSKVNVLALAPVRNGACQGCQLQLPPQFVAEVKRSQGLLSCPYCHRIVYWEEAVRDESTVV